MGSMPEMDLRAGVKGNPGCYHGVIRNGKRIVWQCPHKHINRDETSSVNVSARRCANAVLGALRDDDDQIRRFNLWLSRVQFRFSWEQSVAFRDLAILEAALPVGRALRDSLGLWFSMTSFA